LRYDLLRWLITDWCVRRPEVAAVAPPQSPENL
jgi:hypothetical protein